MSAEMAPPVVVYIARTPLLGEIVKAKLESSGIHAALQYESAGRVLGLTIDGWGETKVIVPAEQADEAREVLASGEGVEPDAGGEE